MRILSVLFLSAAVAGSMAAQQAPPKTNLKVGDMAPDFTLPSTAGKPVTLSDFRGKSAVVLAFFPAAFTGGCTKEMLAYQASLAKLEGVETQVFGISADNTPSQKEFADKLKLTFPLLSDFAKRQVAADYGVLIVDRGFANRATFVIDKEGRIQHIEEGSAAIDPTGAETACARIHHKNEVGQALGLRRPPRPPGCAFNKLEWVFDRARVLQDPLPASRAAGRDLGDLQLQQRPALAAHQAPVRQRIDRCGVALGAGHRGVGGLRQRVGRLNAGQPSSGKSRHRFECRAARPAHMVESAVGRATVKHFRRLAHRTDQRQFGSFHYLVIYRTAGPVQRVGGGSA